MQKRFLFSGLLSYFVMEKFLNRIKEEEFISRKLSGYISPGGKLFLSDPNKLLIKRVIDVMISSLVLVFVLSWLFPLLALFIKLDSSGPLLIKQRKHGRGNKVFFYYKFRTKRLNLGADQRQVSNNEAGISSIGRFLKRTSLDEFPQFINVLLGDMSIVGPRPHPVKMNLIYGEQIDNYKFRHVVKPGITGLAQSRGFRGEVMDYFDISGSVRLDHFYICKWCLFLDLKIVFWTIRGALSSKGKGI